MKDPDVVKRTIESSLGECSSHLSRLERVKGILDAFFPLTVEKFKKLRDEEIGYIDQFIYRFTRLQDSLGTRLLPALHSLLEGGQTPLPFLDVLNRLEQLGVVSSVADWQFFRGLRNNLAHDYPETLNQTVMTLNTLLRELKRFEDLYRRIKDYYQGRKV